MGAGYTVDDLVISSLTATATSLPTEPLALLTNEEASPSLVGIHMCRWIDGSTAADRHPPILNLRGEQMR